MLSRSAVERYGNGDTRKLADELGVEKVLEGTVRIDKERLRIAVQLINAKTEQALWSNQYDHALQDMLAAESDIAAHIAAAFTTAITPGERQRIGKPVSQSPVAYDLYLQAKKLSQANAETTARAIDLLKQAVDIDPHFAAAMAEIGFRSLYPRHIDEAYHWAQRAIDMDPDLADGYVALAGANADRGMASKARAEWLKALELDPNRLQPMQYLVSATLDVGQFEESLHWGRLALERNPKAPKNLAMVAGTLVALGDFPDADRLLQLGQQHFPNSYLVPQMRAMEAITKQDPAQALQIARNLRAARPKAVEVQALLADMALAARSSDADELNRGFYQEALDQSFSNWLLFPESARVSGSLTSRGATGMEPRLGSGLMRPKRMRSSAGSVVSNPR